MPNLGNKTINLLDHGFVRLVDFMGSDLSIVRAARVSHNADWRTGEEENSDKRLINYLWKNKHTTPFESVTITFEVQAPIFIFRQWHRHRTQSYNEVSARYTELPELYYVPKDVHIGTQDIKNKQARKLQEEVPTEMEEAIGNQLFEFRKHCIASFLLYNDLLNSGWPRELARMCLPLSTYSRMFVTANLLNWLKFVTLRWDEHAQWEIQQYGKAVFDIIREIVPVTAEAFITTHEGIPL